MNQKEKNLLKDLTLEAQKLLAFYKQDDFVGSEEFEKKMKKRAMKENNQNFFEMENKEEVFKNELNKNKIKSVNFMIDTLKDIKEIIQEG